MKRTNSIRSVIVLVLYLFFSFSSHAQDEVYFTNKVSFTKTGNISGIRLVAVIPIPRTNEYQEISSLKTNYGKCIDTDNGNKILFYDGTFENSIMDLSESFLYKTKKIIIDFNNKNEKNQVTEINPNEYLDSDGKFIDVNNTTIQRIGDQLWSEAVDTIDYAKRCYEYVATHYKYINGSWRTLTEIIEAGGGECGDFTTLFVNLMRYKGIPARHNIGIYVEGGYHVWPDFYHNDYGWIPVDPTFKNSNRNGDYFGRYDGGLIIVSQGLTSFSESDIEINNMPLQTFYYWYWYTNGQGSINGTHQMSKDYQVDRVESIETFYRESDRTYNLMGVEQKGLHRGLNIKNRKKVYVR